MDSTSFTEFMPAVSAGIMAPVAVQTGDVAVFAAVAAVPAAGFAGSWMGSRLSLFEKHARKLLSNGMVKATVPEVASKISAAVFGAVFAGAVLAAVLLTSAISGGVNVLTAAAAIPIAASPLMAVMPYVNKASERKTTLDVEYPFFTVFSAITAYCGGTVYTALQQVKKAGHVFRQMSREAVEVERKAMLAGVGVIKGIEAHAETIPHENMSRTLLTVTSVWRTGGDLVSTLDDLSAEALKFLTDKFERFTST
ncbi:MAG: hypothetical protein QXG41_09240, partial [Candidatus Caldarchaeum sp.]